MRNNQAYAQLMLRIAINSCAKGVHAQLMPDWGQVLDELTKIAIQDGLGFLLGAAPKVGQTADRHCDFPRQDSTPVGKRMALDKFFSGNVSGFCEGGRLYC